MTFPIYQNFPMYEGVEPNTDFIGNEWLPLSIPSYASTTFKQACLGQPVHGLHFDTVVLNTLDFGAPKTIQITERFTTLEIVPQSDPPDMAWDGVKLVPRRDRVPVASIASGYLCGSTTLIRVPGTLIHTPTNEEKEKLISWKDYALRSTERGFVLGMELGKGGFLFTAGVGKTFWITFKGSVGTKDLTRRIRFGVERFGICGLPSDSFDLEYDTGKKDYTPGGMVTTTMVGLNDTVSFGMKLCDVAINGTKCVLGLYILGDYMNEDDGVNQTSSWCLSFAECTFSMNGADRISVSGKIAQTFTDTDTSEGNSFVSGKGAIIMPGQLRREQVLDEDPDWIAVGGVLTDTQVFFDGDYSDKVLFTGTLTTDLAVYSTLDGQPQRIKSGNPNITLGIGFVQQGIGQSRRISSGASYDIRIMRTIHMCYNDKDILVPITVSYTEVDNILIETTLSVSCTGTGTHNRKLSQTYWFYPDPSYPNGSFVNEGSGNASYTIVTAREQYSRRCIELRVNGALVDYLQYENATPQRKTTTTATFGYNFNTPGTPPGVAGYTTQPESITDTPPPIKVDNYSPALPGITGPLFISGYAPIKQAGGSGSIRNFAIANKEDPKAVLRFFVRLESNKLVSATVGDAGYSMGVNEVASGTFPYRYEILAAGNHIKKTTWNCYTSAKAVNNVADHGFNDNPAFNIPGGEYHSAFNVETKQCVLNGTKDYTFI